MEVKPHTIVDLTQSPPPSSKHAQHLQHMQAVVGHDGNDTIRHKLSFMVWDCIQRWVGCILMISLLVVPGRHHRLITPWIQAKHTRIPVWLRPPPMPHPLRPTTMPLSTSQFNSNYLEARPPHATPTMVKSCSELWIRRLSALLRVVWYMLSSVKRAPRLHGQYLLGSKWSSTSGFSPMVSVLVSVTLSPDPKSWASSPNVLGRRSSRLRRLSRMLTITGSSPCQVWPFESHYCLDSVIGHCCTSLRMTSAPKQEGS